LFSHLSKLNKEIQANQGHQRGATTLFFFCKLTYVLKEEDTKIIRGIPQIYNEKRNIKQQMATG